MKNPLSFFVMALVGVFAMSLTACNNGGGRQNNGIVAFPTTLTFTSDGGEKSVTVTSELEWNTAASAEWITITKTGNAFTVVAESTLEARSGYITVNNGVSQTIVTVEQAAPGMMVEFAAGGGQQSITFEGGAGWTLSAQDAWIDAVKTDNSTITITVAASTGAERSGRITIDDGGNQSFITVVQKELVILSSNRVYAGANNGTHIFDLNFYCYEFNESGVLGDGGYHIRIELHTDEIIADRRDYYFETGVYTFSTPGNRPAVIAGGESLTGSWLEWAPNPSPGENITKISTGTFTFTDNGNDSYTVRLDATLEDGTPFVANYTGPMAAINPFIVSTLDDDVNVQIANGAGTLGFMGDWSLNGTYQWAVRVYDQGMTYVPPFGFGSGSYTGSGNLMIFEFIGPQEGDGQIIPAGTYTLKPIYQSDPMAGINTAWSVYSGFDSGMGRVGSWFHEVTDGYFTQAAPAMTGEVTVSYSGGKHIFEYNILDDAGNTISGRAEGTLQYSYEGE